jgi:hypothetical protein
LSKAAGWRLPADMVDFQHVVGYCQVMKESKIPANPKDMLIEHVRALKRFNEWEQHRVDRMDGDQCLAAVFALYRLIPEDARKRAVDVGGIIKMRKALACLK